MPQYHSVLGMFETLLCFLLTANTSFFTSVTNGSYLDPAVKRCMDPLVTEVKRHIGSQEGFKKKFNNVSNIPWIGKSRQGHPMPSEAGA